MNPLRRPAPFARRLAAFAVLAALWSGAAASWGPAAAQTTVRQDVFTVSGVTVDVSAADASVARDRALIQGQRKAWDDLFRQLLPPGAKPPAVSDVELSRAVQNFSIDDERLSPGRYAAVMTVRFAPEPVRRAMADSGAAAYVEPATRPMVLLPVTVRPDGTSVLWDDRTAWRAAWEEHEAKPAALTPLTVPDGELSDVAAVSAQEAVAGDEAAFGKIAAQHGAGGVVVAKTALGADPTQGMQVEVRLFTLDGVNVVKTVNVRPDPADRPEDLLSRAVVSAVAAVDELWRRERTVSAGPAQTLLAVMPLNGLGDWIAARERLGRIGGGARIDMVSLSRTAATVSVGYRGDVAELQARMQSQGLTLRQDAGGWMMTAAPAAPSAQTAPAVSAPAVLTPVRP